MEDSAHIILDSELGIADAERVHHLLRGSYANTRTVTIDLTQTERIDTSIAQLLYTYMRSAQSSSIRVDWKLSGAVTKAMEKLGLTVQSGSDTGAAKESIG